MYFSKKYFLILLFFCLADKTIGLRNNGSFARRESVHFLCTGAFTIHLKPTPSKHSCLTEFDPYDRRSITIIFFSTLLQRIHSLRLPTSKCEDLPVRLPFSRGTKSSCFPFHEGSDIEAIRARYFLKSSMFRNGSIRPVATGGIAPPRNHFAPLGFHR